MPEILDITTLGGLTFKLGKKIITEFTSRKAEALLVYLALSEKEMVNREELASILWEESPEPEALLNLRVVLSNLKKLFPDHLQITRRKVGWVNNAHFIVDAIRIHDVISSITGSYNPRKSIVYSDAKTVMTIVQLYHGDFLQGFYIKNSIAFENWLMYERESLKLEINNVSHICLNSFIENNDSQNGIVLANFLLKLDPFSELTYRKLMQLYALKGQLDTVVDCYKKCTNMLSKELSSTPENETIQIYDLILARKYPNNDQSVIDSYPSLPPPQNLPKILDPIIGRETEIKLISDYIDIKNERLITLIGQGGIGKTRLAIEVVQKKLRLFHDGVWFIPCSNILSIDLLMPMIAKVLDITLKDNQDVSSQVIEWLDDKNTLLILDNFEDLTEASPIITSLIQNSKNIRFLLTSREPLNSPYEKVILVDGLDYPDFEFSPFEKQKIELRLKKKGQKVIKEYSSVQLFIERVRKHFRNYRPDSKELIEIGYLCQILGGSPLAIELAAIGMKTLSVSSILRLVESDLSLLKTDKPELPERQRSLLAIFETFWKQLSNDEQRVIADLSVFRGVVTIDAAKFIADASPFLLNNLVSRGVLHRVEPSGYRAHSIQRQYISEKLAQNKEEWERIHNKHRDYYYSFLTTRSTFLRDKPDRKVLNEIEFEINNIRAALDLTIKMDDEEKSLNFCEMLMPFWKIRGYFEEGYYWLDKTLALKTNASPALRANALCAVARLVSDLGDYQKASELGEESLHNSKRIGNKHGVAKALNSLGAASSAIGEYKKARQYYEESLQIYRNLRVQQAIAGTLNKLAAIDLFDEKYQKAIDLLLEALNIFQSVSDNVGIARVYNSLCRAYLQKGLLNEAYQAIISALSIGWDLGYWNIISYSLENFANYSIINKKYEYATKVLTIVELIHQRISYTLPPHEQKIFNKTKQLLKREMGSEQFEKAVQTGQSIILEEFIRELLISG